VVLWTRVSAIAGDEPITWTVTEHRGDDVVARGECERDEARDGTIHVPVSGLAAGRRYDYSFARGNERSPVGSFRTLPRDGTLRFAVICCAKYNSGYFNVYEHVAALDDIDFVLHLGDYIYEAAEVPAGRQTPGRAMGRPFEPLWECKSLDDYRVRYAQYRSDPQIVAMHRRHAMIATLDDHELADNAWQGGAEEHDPERDGPWAARMDAALRAWEEWTPTLRRPTTGDRICTSASLGSGSALALLETRTHRMPQGRGEPSCLIDPGQRTWLEHLANTTSGLLVVGSPSTVSQLHLSGMQQNTRVAMSKLKLLDPDSDALPYYDLWDAYPDDRRWLRDLLRARAPRPSLVLSGDVHVAFDTTFVREGGLRVPEWTCPSTTSQNLDDKMGWPRHGPSREHENAFLEDHPDFEWCDLDSHGHLIVEVAPDVVACQWWMAASVTEQGLDGEVEHTARLDLKTPVPETTSNLASDPS
jgi:alkaline phosphatase D